jgi:flagellin
MALTVATNTGALMAQAAASSVNKEMETSMERLSTGKRINSASDDAAGVAIASRLSAEIAGTNQAIRNAMDGQALIDTAEGAHAEVENILQRMRELAVQAANDTNDSTDRAMMQEELDNLIDEIDRISSTTTWAGIELLDGTASAIKLQIGSGTTAADQVSVAIGSLASNGTLMTHTTNSSADIRDYKSTSSSAALPTMAISFLDSSGAAVTTEMTGTYNSTTGVVDIADITANNAGTSTVTQMKLILNSATDNIVTLVDISSATTAAAIAAELADVFTAGDTVLPGIAVNEDNVSAGRIVLSGATSASGGGLTTVASARNVIDTIDGVLENLNTQRATLGAISNRLDSTVSNLTNISSNLQSGRGRIEDADFAAETTNLAKTQILQQASTAMLAQANASKQNVLSLLQG